MCNVLLELPDAQLISAYAAGDPTAMEQLVLRYKDKIFTAIHVLLRDRALAEDVFQDCFLKIIRTIQEDRYAEQGKFLPFALRVAHNLCMDHFRRQRVRPPKVSLPEGKDVGHLLDEQAPDASLRMERHQDHALVRSLVERLPTDQREVIALRIYGELSFKEIAEITDVSINTALGRMRYGLLNLRKMIAKEQTVLR